MSGAQTGKGVKGKPLSTSTPYFQCIRQELKEGTAEIPSYFQRDFFGPKFPDLDCAALSVLGNLPPVTRLPTLFQDYYAPDSPWMFKGQLSETLASRFLNRTWGYSIEASRYPLIHELTSRRGSSEIAKEKLAELIDGIGRILEEGRDPESVRTDLREARRYLDLYEKDFRVLEKWATQDGKDKAISREAALDIAFQLARAQSAMDSPDSDSKVAASRRLLWETHKRRFGAPDTLPELKFGLAVIDLNVTAPNAVDRNLGDLVLETTYKVMKDFFKNSVVTRGTRTNFRVVNPDGSQLSQEKVLELEKLIYNSLAEKIQANGNRKWKRFLEKYQINLSGGYDEVKFEIADVKKNAKGEYERSTVIELLERVDHAFRVASARSQEVVGRLKDAKNSARAPRLNHGQFPIPDLNGIPEGRFFEPLEPRALGADAFRLIHSLKRIFENFRAIGENLGNLEWMLSEAKSDPAKRVEGRAKAAESLKMLEENRSQFHDIYYDISHDLRMPRMVDRPMVAERVDSIVAETGGARLLFLELGKFHSFVRAWYGGNQDKYVHELIYDFYKILTKKGLNLVHPANQSPLLATGQFLALDPRTGKYFTTVLSAGGVPDVQLLANPRSGNPIATEGIVGMRDGDEIGFVIGERDAKGRVVKEKTIRDVFTEFDEAIQNRGAMFFDDVEKVGADKVRTPQWQLREYRAGITNGKGKYVITEPRMQKLESEAVKNFTGLLLDYEGVTWEETDPSVSKENAKVIIGRRPRWRYYENGKLSPTVEIFYGEPLFFNRGSSGPSPQGLPDNLVKAYPEVAGRPILVKLQTTLTAGYVSVDFQEGAELDAAWNLANNLSKKSKNQKGQPVMVKLKPNGHEKPVGYDYDRSVSALRTEELGQIFGKYSAEKNALHEPRLSPELAEWLRGRQRGLMEMANPRDTGVFEGALIQTLRKDIKNAEFRDRLVAEVRDQVAKGGELTQLRDALIALQVLEREGLSLNLKPLAPGLWTALSAGQEILATGEMKSRLGKAKTLLVKLHVQQTGELPPPDVLNEARKYVDPVSVFIPEEVYALARTYRIAPEKVPYFVAGLKADKIRELGQEAFRSLTYEDLHKLAESPEAQNFLRDPKNALLLQDTLGSRVAYQGVPLLTAMLSVIPAEKLSGYLAEKAAKKMGLKGQQVQELKFGITLYFAHTINITAAGAWEVLLNRGTAAKALSEAIGSQINIGILRTAKVAGQPMLQVGLRSGGGLGRALADGVLEKWGISSFSKMGFGGVAWHVAKGIPRVPFQMLKTMGAGYLASRLFDLGASAVFAPDHPVRKYGGFVAFFLPDILRMTLGSSRIAASPLLRTTGGLFNRAGNRVLLVAIADFAFSKIFVKNDYERTVHKRVADQVYDEEVFRVSLKKDWWVLPLGVKLLRMGSRALAPNSIDWAVTHDNPKLKETILAQDREASAKMTEFWKNGLTKVLLHAASFDPLDENAYTKLDLGMLSKPVELDAMEKRALDALSNCLGPPKEETLRFVPPDLLDKTLQRVFIYQLQEAARFLVLVDQKENAWAREAFNDDGTLKEGKGSRLLEALMPAKSGEPSPEQKLLSSRKIMVALAMLDDQGLFNGASLSKTAHRAGLTNVSGDWILSDEWKTALSLYAAQAHESKDPKALEKLTKHTGRLLAEYLKAPESERKAYREAFACIGLNPELTEPTGSE